MSQYRRRLDQPRDDALRRLTVAPTEIEAEMLAEQLRRHGVDPLVRIEDDVRASTRALGGARWAYPIYVLESDLDRARAILAAVGHEGAAASAPARRTEILIGSLITIGVSLAIVLILMARTV